MGPGASVIERAMAEIMREPMLTRAQAGAMLVPWPAPIAEDAVIGRTVRSELISLPTDRGHRYPQFQFDEAWSDIHRVVSDVNVRLDAARDPWGVASWWLTPHVRLGARPADLAGVDRQKNGRWGAHDSGIIAASKALLAPLG